MLLSKQSILIEFIVWQFNHFMCVFCIKCLDLDLDLDLDPHFEGGILIQEADYDDDDDDDDDDEG